MSHDWDENSAGRVPSQKSQIELTVEGHSCTTVPEAGFAGMTNGELLRLAQRQFDVFITLDRGVRYQQNLAGSKVAVLLIRVKSSRLADILPHIPVCLEALRSIRPGQIIQVGEGSRTSN